MALGFGGRALTSCPKVYEGVPLDLSKIVGAIVVFAYGILVSFGLLLAEFAVSTFQQSRLSRMMSKRKASLSGKNFSSGFKEVSHTWGPLYGRDKRQFESELMTILEVAMKTSSISQTSV